jgi:uncharacterized protein YndB with AHSA1/START domain
MIKRVLKFLFGAVAVIGLGLTVGSLFLSSNFHVERRIAVAAALEQVYALIAEPRRWKEWSVWNQRDPAMQISYEGPASGVGAVWSWKSESQGDGRMSFTAAEPGRRLAYDLFFPDFGTTSKGELRLAPATNGTEVVWTMHGNMGSNPMFRWIALFADGMVGQDFEAGLKNLKAVAEKR